MSKEGDVLISNIKKRGYLYDYQNNCYEPPGSPRFNELQVARANTQAVVRKSLKSPVLKSAWIDDTRNLKNKTGRFDSFIALVRLDLGLDVWPEFRFLLPPLPDYRFDYAIPTGIDGGLLKIAIECDGGTHARGNSGHSSPSGIARDMNKGSLAAVHGWKLIRVTPQQLCTSHTIGMIRQAAKL